MTNERDHETRRTWTDWLIADVWDVKSISKLLACPLCAVVWALVQKDWPTGPTRLYVVASWLFGAGCLFGAFLGFGRNAKVRRFMLAVVSLSLMLLACDFLLVRYYLMTLNVEWPQRVFSYEAIVGGRFQNIDLCNCTIKLYVCCQTDKGPECFLQQFPAHLERGIWESVARFGNEEPENNYARSPIEFWVVPVVGPTGFERTLPPLVKGTPSDLICALDSGKFVTHIGQPFRVDRIFEQRCSVTFRRILHSGRDPIEIPPFRAASYFVRPPVTVSWASTTGEESPAYLEVWYDSSRATVPRLGVNYKLDEWPQGVTRIEIKISNAPEKGPYDSIYLEHLGGP